MANDVALYFITSLGGFVTGPRIGRRDPMGLGVC